MLNKRYYGMRNVEIADALAKIAVNDVNKKTVSTKCLMYEIKHSKATVTCL